MQRGLMMTLGRAFRADNFYLSYNTSGEKFVLRIIHSPGCVAAMHAWARFMSMEIYHTYVTDRELALHSFPIFYKFRKSFDLKLSFCLYGSLSLSNN